MPTHKSARKRMRTSKKENLNNRNAKSAMNTAIKTVLSAKDKKSAESALKLAYSALDKNVKSGLIHVNKAAHKKSQLARAIVKTAA